MAKFREVLINELLEQDIAPICCVTRLGYDGVIKFIGIDHNALQRLYNLYILSYVSNFELNRHPDFQKNVINYVLKSVFNTMSPQEIDPNLNFKYEAHHILPISRWDSSLDSERVSKPSDAMKNGILLEQNIHRRLHVLANLLESLEIRPLEILTEFFSEYQISLYLEFANKTRITMAEAILIILAHKNLELWLQQFEENHEFITKLELILRKKGLIASTSVTAILNRRHNLGTQHITGSQHNPGLSVNSLRGLFPTFSNKSPNITSAA